MRKILGITMGDPAGVGPEITVKALQDPKVYESCKPLVVGDAAILERACGFVGAKCTIHPVADPSEGLYEHGIIDILDLGLLKPEDFAIGQVSAAAGDAAFRYVRKVIELAMDGKVDATVTNPLNKEAMNLAGHHFSGHTEIYAYYTGTEHYTMMLAHKDLRVVHVSTHVSLREACDRVKKDRVLEVIRIADKACRDMGIASPRIGVAGLNPHCGEGGLFGREEIDEITPAIEAARTAGINAQGPIPPDTIFSKALGGWYDIVVAMYHDQGHIPLKVVGFVYDREKQAWSAVEGVNITKALETLKAYYGKDNPNYYPLTGRDTAIRFASWFGAASNISSTESHGIYINGHYKDGSIDIMNDGAYKMVETMKKWYDEGLIQPEWVTGTFGEADWEAAMLNGNGSVFYDYYNRAEWFMENGGPDNDPNYQMGVLNFIKDDNGNPQKMPVSMKYNDECVTAINANCSEDKIKTILTFIDYFYSEEGEILANYGVEGESFKDTNGDKEFIVDYQTEEATPAGEKRWSFLSDRFTVCKPVDNEAFFKWNAPLIAEATGRLFTDENLGTSYVLKFTDDQSKEDTNLLASVYDAQMSGIAQFIDGTRELTPDNWAAFQQEMNDLGLSRIEEIQLAAYQAMYGA